MKAIKNWFRSRKQKTDVLRDLGQLLSIPAKDIEKFWQTFDQFYQQHNYAQTLGESKTLNQLESFIAYVVLASQRPESIVEIGTYYGKSTRRIIDMKNALGLAAPVTCYDITNDVRFFETAEANLILADITPDPTRFLSAHQTPQFIFLDARPFDLLKNVVTSCLNDLPNAIMIIHDCCLSLCRREMMIDHSCLEISSSTGVWERHVLAECFAVSDPTARDLDNVSTSTHQLMIFNTEYGLALLIPHRHIRVLSARIHKVISQ
jgi:predicted O-methyltransferase YrrM